jgi:hypothetical protein
LEEEAEEIKAKYDEALGKAEAALHITEYDKDCKIHSGVKETLAKKDQFAKQYSEKVSEHNEFANKTGYKPMQDEILAERERKVISKTTGYDSSNDDLSVNGDPSKVSPPGKQNNRFVQSKK